MPRIALFGGSFNPPHLAHSLVALYVLETAPVDELWITPTFRHAFGKDLASYDDRIAMCELAAAALGPRVRVSRAEEDAARAHQHAVRPQHDAAVTGRAGKDAALLDETGADAEPAGRGLDIEQAQPGGALVGAFDEKYRAHDLAFALGDPAGNRCNEVCARLASGG